MTDKLFDNFFQDKLRDHSSKVPEGLWTKIEEELRPEEDKKFVLLFRRWYGAAAILVLALSAAAWLYVNSGDKTGKLTDQAAVPAQPNTAGKTPGSISAISVTAGTTSVTRAEQEKAGIVEPGTAGTTEQGAAGSTASAKASSAAAESNAPAALNRAAVRKNTITQSTTATAAATGVARNKQKQGVPATTDSNTPGNSEAMAGSSQSAKTAETTPLRAGRKGKPIRSGNWVSPPLYGTADPVTTTTAPPAAAGNTLQAGAGATDQAAFAPLPSEMAAIPAAQKADYATLLRQYIQSQDNSFFPIIRCPPVRNTVPSDLFIEAYASPDKVFRQSSANNGANDYTAKRDTMLSLRTSFTAGVRISKALTENLLLKAGLQYSQINENFHYRLENERKTVTVVTTHTITNSPGDTVVVRDTTTYEQIGYIEKRIKNRYRSIDIPVLLSYEWGNSQWRFAVNGGPVINLRSWYSGEIPDTSSQLSSVKGTSEVFKKNIGLGAHLGLSVIKTINDNMDLFAEPWVRYNFSDMTQKGQAFSQKFTTTGLSLGIRYRLNGGQRY